jgi:hypothetical protein
MSMYDMLYKSFPRQIAYPYRKTVEEEEFYSFIDRLNGKVRIFSSVYNFTANSVFDKFNLDLDKIFFDFDGEKAIENAKLFAKCLIEQNLKHLILFSGGGFHIYLFTIGYSELKNKKACLTNAHKYLIDKYKIDVDKAIIGDIARVATVPNTWNTKRKRYCIPVTIEDLNKGYEHISELAKEQNFDFTLYGTKLFDISSFDGSEDYGYAEMEVSEEIRKQINEDELLSSMPECLSAMLANANSGNRVGWRGRFLILVYLRDRGILYGNACDIITAYLKHSKSGIVESHHCIREEQQARRVYGRDETMFPSCEQLKREGICPVSGFCSHCREGDYGVHLQTIYR